MMPPQHAVASRSATLAIGILTVDHANYAWRRDEQRIAWVNAANAMSPIVHARFVLRCGLFPMSPAYPAASREGYQPSSTVRSENKTYGDVLCLDAVPVDAGRLKGPSLAVLAWFEHALLEQQRGRHHGEGRDAFIATVDDDAYIHVPDILTALANRPAEASRFVYAGAIVGWSFHVESYRFHSFGWSGCANCSGPFPFAVGAFLCVSSPLARALVDSTRDEVRTVYALRPDHKVFYQDAFIGQAVYRLAAVDETIDVLQLDEVAIDTDGFVVPPSLAIWHNRWKIRCRVVALGEFFSHDDGAYRCSGVGHLEWGRIGHLGRVNMTKYRIWYMRSHRRASTSQGVLKGQAALLNRTCKNSINLRDIETARALNMSSYMGCIEAVSAAKHHRGGGS
jgi:hypothetical protein